MLHINQLVGFGAARSAVVTTDVEISAGGTSAGGFANPSSVINMNAKITNSVTVTRLGLKMSGSRTLYLGIVERTSANNFTVLYSEQFSVTGTSAFEYFTLATPQSIPASGDYYCYATGNLGPPNVFFYDNVSGTQYASQVTSGSFTSTESTNARLALAYTKES